MCTQPVKGDILIVDDALDSLRLLSAMLNEQGYGRLQAQLQQAKIDLCRSLEQERSLNPKIETMAALEE